MSKKQDIISKLQQEIENREKVAPFEAQQSSPNVNENNSGIENDDETSKAFSRIIKLASHRERSSYELSQKLESEDYSDDAIKNAIGRALACNLVNDERFAQARVRYLVRVGKGIGAIERDISSHNIDLNDVDGWPYDFLDPSYDAEVQRAYEYLQRSPSRSKNAMQGNYNKLIRMGYSASTASTATRKYLDHISEI